MYIKLILLILFFSLNHCAESIKYTKIDPDKVIDKKQLILPENIRLEHLAKIAYQDRKVILHGVFSKQNNNFSLEAFGDFDILLFTVLFKSNIISSKILFDPLKEKKFNADYVGGDLWRIYLANETRDLTLFRKNNKLLTDDKIELKYNEKNYLTHKYFYNKGKMTYRISYSDYHNFNGVILAKLITCEHLVYKYKLKIVTLNILKSF